LVAQSSTSDLGIFWRFSQSKGKKVTVSVVSEFLERFGASAQEIGSGKRAAYGPARMHHGKT
jgi:hypothetical protein